METREKIIEISRYIGDHEIACIGCGVVVPIDEVLITEQGTKAGVRWRAECPECEKFIKFMPTEKIKRVWYKGGLHQIADMETGLLMWFISKNVHSDTTRKYIHAVLLGRMDSAAIPDVVLSGAETRELDNSKKREAEITTLVQNIAAWQKDAIAFFNDGSWDQPQQETARKNIIRWKRRLANLQD